MYAFRSRLLRLALAAALLLGRPALVVRAANVCAAGFSSLQAAINAAAAGDTVRVPIGPYTGTLVLDRTVNVQGGWDAACSRRVTTDPAATAVYAAGAGTVLSISGGSTATVEGLALTGGLSLGNGGGVSIVSASPTLRGNLVTNNVVSSTLAGSGRGAGIYILTGAPVIEGNTIVSNTARNALATEGGGGGIFVQSAAPIIRGNRILSNTVQGLAGGGLYALSAGAGLVSRNLIAGNQSQSWYGGGVADRLQGSLLYENNLVTGNHAAVEGDGFYFSNTTAELVNNTIVANDPAGASEGVAIHSVYPVSLTNNIVVSHATGLTLSGNPAPLSRTNLVWANSVADYGGVLTASTDLHADPLFANPALGDYGLRLGSPAINAGSVVAPGLDFYGAPRPAGGGFDIGAAEWIAARLLLPLVVR